jgi:hypothetical protein
MFIFFRTILYLFLFILPSLGLTWYIDGQEKYRKRKAINISILKILFFCNKRNYIPSGKSEKLYIIKEHKGVLSIFSFFSYLVAYLLLILYVILLLYNEYYNNVNNLYFFIIFILNIILLIVLIIKGLINEKKLRKK